MKRLDMHSKDLVNDNIQKIGSLFPNCIVENKIDFSQLRQELSDIVVDEKKEKYQLTWVGKKNSILESNRPISKTLISQINESFKFDTTKNIYIEGDNLDVLKILQESYLNKIKCIYIDPPYNTGNDFIYNDNFKKNSTEELADAGDVDEYNNRLTSNSNSNGRFHSDWLNMMYPRLKLARNLLTKDGIIFISIDDNEVDNLKKLCSEIYGESNFIAELIWQNKKGGGNDSIHIATEHEYILVFAKSKNDLSEFYEQYSEDYIKRYKEEDSIGKYFWDTFKRKSGKQYYPIHCPDGTILQYDEDGNPISWLRSKDRFEQDIKNGEVRIVKIGDKWSVQFKQRIPKGKKPRSIFRTEQLLDNVGTTSDGASDVYTLFKKDVFSNPKPVELIKFLLGFGLTSNDIVLDFFSGSATTAEAVMSLNANDNGNRRYILVQIPEKINNSENSTTNRGRIQSSAIELLDSLNKPYLITNIAKERIKRAAKKIKDETNADIDYGFRVYTVDSSNMKNVYYEPSKLNQTQLNMFESNIKEDRTAEDLLTQVILDLGLTLDLNIEEKNILDNKVFFVAGNSLVACFDDKINIDIINQICEVKPLKIVFRESSFMNDSAKINAYERIKKLSPETEICVI